ncbi:MAG: LysM peptidoglycan-binding domain-containing protein, partial [Anaerolineales bacterium]|nr:LysM peptidoglycan-binding domain-containing protein [Anaerolineales bacterium]
MRHHKRKMTLVWLLSLALFLFACQDEPDPQPTIVLEVPDPLPATATAEPTVTPTEAATAEPTVTNEPATEPTVAATAATTVAQAPDCQPPADWIEYNVVFGDTLAELARRTGSSVAALSEANCLDNPNRITVGLKLRVPRQPDPLPTPPPATLPPGNSTTVYDISACYSYPFWGNNGVAIGELWRVDYGVPSAPVFAQMDDLTPAGHMLANEPFTVKSGPFCFYNAGYAQLPIRRWYVESETSNQKGWLEEYHDYLQWQPAPEIVSFTVSARQVDEGESVTISWEVRGANDISIFQSHPLNQYSQEIIAGPLPPAGTLVVTTPATVRHVDYGIVDNYFLITQLRVDINCLYEPFVLTTAQGCATGPVSDSEAAYQPFERGFMVWKPGVIWVFNEQGYGTAFYDGFTGVLPPFNEEPPAGLYKPEHGFGKVWLENPWIREQLGWATAPEA